MRVLLIEDDLGDAHIAKQMLRKECRGTYFVSHVENIKAALQALVEEPHGYDVVLLDLNLSDSSGLQGFSAITKVVDHKLPIVILSGIDDDALADKAIQLDAQDFLSKQIMSGAALDRAIRYAIERHKTRRELADSRERFRQFARVSSDRFWETDAEHRFLDSTGTLKDNNLPVREDVIGKRIWDIPGYRILSEPDWTEHLVDLDKHRPFRDLEVVYKSDDGENVYWAMSGEPVFDDDRMFAGYRGTASNITERKIAERELLEAKQDLERLNAQKDKFFSLIAHDLRAPFAGVMGSAELFRMGLINADTDNWQKYGDMVYVSANRALSLVQDLLEWSRLQLKDNDEYIPEQFRLSPVIDDNIELASDMAGIKNIRLVYEAEGETGVEAGAELGAEANILADKGAINAILRNLIANAIKFSHDGATVTIKTRQRDKHIEIAVCDEGVGIPEDQIKALGSLSEGITTVGTAGEIGTGLGLVLCKELVERAGGELVIESPETKGTTVRFSVPVIDFD